MSRADFREHIAGLTARIAGRSPDAELDTWLNREHGAGSCSYMQLKQACDVVH